MIQRHLHGILCDIIDQAYPDAKNKDKYKRFSIEYSIKNSRGAWGIYSPMSKLVTLRNIKHRDPKVIMTTAIHEVAHHIEYINTGDTGHKEGFYAEYTKMLYAALDLNIISVEDYKEKDKRAREYNKVVKILEKYAPSRKVVFRENTKRMDAYIPKQEKTLKKYSYEWDSTVECWTKEISPKEIKAESFLLENYCISYTVSDYKDIKFISPIEEENYCKLRIYGYEWDEKGGEWSFPSKNFEAINNCRIKLPNLIELTPEKREKEIFRMSRRRIYWDEETERWYRIKYKPISKSTYNKILGITEDNNSGDLA